MKKHLFIRIIAIAAIVIGFTAFMIPSGNIGGLNSPVEKNSYSGEKFSKISISISAKVNIEQGDVYSVLIDADENTLEKILVEYSSDELHISSKPASRINSPVEINITTPTLNAISLAGSGEVYMKKTFETSSMDLEIAGSGSMSINDLKADKVSASIAGSGDLVLAGGKAGSYEDFSIAGSGKVDALNFKSSTADVEIAGSGDCKLFATEKLNVSIAGSGTVYYKGKPVLKSESVGSGKVVSID